MTARLNWLWVVGVMILTGVCCQAQQNATGRQAFGSFSGGPDIINLGNLDVSLDIPILHRPGRGIPFVFDLTYDSSLVWTPVTTNGATTWTPQPGWGWPVPISAVGYVPPPVVYTTGPIICGLHVTETTTWWIYSGYVDVHGTMHHVPNLMTSATSADASCGGNKWTDASAATDDGSGYSISILHGSVSTATVTSKGGATFTAPIGSGTATVAQDSNGNKITVDPATGKFYDTLSSSTPVLTVTGTSPVNYAYTAPSGSVNVVVSYKSYPVQTHFLCSGVTDYGVSSPIHNNLVDKITYPDGSFYQFAYEPTTTGSGNVTGRIKSVTLPTGGTISYAYTGSNGGINCADGTTMGFDRTTPDSATPWHYSRSGPNPSWTTTVTDPLSNVTTYNFYEVTQTTSAGNGFGSASISTYTYYERNRTMSSGLQTVLTCYNGVYANCGSATLSLPISQVDQYVSLGSKTSATETKYDTAYGGRVTEVKQYDFGVSTGGAPPPSLLLKATIISYATLTGIIDHPYQVTVEDGSGNVKAQTTYTYSDTVTGTAGTPQHTSPSGSRGNPVTIASLTSGSATLSKSFTYYDTGNVKVATDVNGAQTTYTYGACGNSFVTEIQLPLSLTEYLGWDNTNTCVGAVMTSSTEVNGNVTTDKFTDPYYWRVAEVDYPDGGITKYIYNTSSTPWDIATSSRQVGATYVTTDTVLDGLGRTSKAELTSDPAGTDSVDTTYDALGRVASISNPHRSTSSPTDGITEYTYDALSRTTRITQPDNTHRDFTYAGAAAQLTDEGRDSTGANHVTKIYQSDGLGRPISLCEVANTTQQGTSNTTAVPCNLDISGTGFLTSYAYGYDATRGNLFTSVQPGLGTRSYYSDGLSRMTEEVNPESGTTLYTYDCTGQTGDMCTRNRPAANQSYWGTNTITTYTHDGLHRLTGITYSNTDNSPTYTAPVTLSYDQTTADGMTLSNAKGRLSSASTVTGSITAAQVFSYDVMGRPLDNSQCIAATCTSSSSFTHMPYTYDYAGDMASSPYVNGIVISYGYDAAAHLTQVTSSLVDANHPASFLSDTTYNPLGELTAADSGTVSGSTGFSQVWNYDNRGRGTYYRSAIYGGPTIQIQSGITYAGNSDVLSYADGILGYNWSHAYDEFNRLQGTTQSGAPSGNVGYSYNYDRYGNRWHQTVTAGTGWPSSLSFDSNNHITPASCGSGAYCYDAAGNLTSDTFHNYTYDAEGRIAAVDTTAATYSYDASGRRVLVVKGGHNWYYGYDLSSRVVWEYEDSTPYRGEFYGPKGRLATYIAGVTFFPTQDLVGTVRNMTTQDGTGLESFYSLPFGDGESSWGNYAGLTGPFHFTGQDRDSESNLDHFWFRGYSSTEGRWAAPDPAGLAAVNPMNPQTWNRYAYVTNNPVTYNDPLGLMMGLCHSAENQQCSTNDPSSANTTGFWDELRLFDGEGTRIIYDDYEDGTIDGSDDLFLVYEQGGGNDGSGNSVCSNIPPQGKTIQVNRGPSWQAGTFNFQFNGQANLIGISVSLTTINDVQGSGLSIPPDTSVGFSLTSPGTVQMGFSNPVDIGSGVTQVYFKTATFSGGRYTAVSGAVAPFGIPFGSTSSSSSWLLAGLNGQLPFTSGLSSQAYNFGKFITDLATLASKHLSCKDLFGGG